MNKLFRFSISSKILVSLMLSSVITVSRADGLEVDVDRLGMDYRRVELRAADPLTCQSECVGDAGCKSFTYVKPGLHGRGAVCYLKNGEPNPTPNTCCVSGLRPRVTQAQTQSVLYQAHQAWLARRTPPASIADRRRDSSSIGRRRDALGSLDSMEEYARKCDDATQIKVPGFSCSAGTEVPGQGNIPAGPAQPHCNQPNVLNGSCDPGSKFQVLPGGTADAVAVAHCRKVGLPITGNLYNDIAVIQYNKKTGALCFYQALGGVPVGAGPLPGEDIPPPSAGEARTVAVGARGDRAVSVCRSRHRRAGCGCSADV